MTVGPETRPSFEHVLEKLRLPETAKSAIRNKSAAEQRKFKEMYAATSAGCGGAAWDSSAAALDDSATIPADTGRLAAEALWFAADSGREALLSARTTRSGSRTAPARRRRL